MKINNKESIDNEDVCLQKVFNKVLDTCIELYKLDKETSIYFKSTFFYEFFQLRYSNNMIDNDIIYIQITVFQKFIHQTLMIFKKVYENEIISYQKILDIFKHYLQISRNNKNTTISFKNLTYELSLNHDSTLYITNKKVYNYTKYIVKSFCQNLKLPYELYMVILYDVNLIYLKNRKYFRTLKEFLVRDYILQIVTEQVKSFDKYVPEFFSEAKTLQLRIIPPYKDDFLFNMQLNVYNSTHSLTLITKYFGNKKWHKKFINYDENENDYFEFNQESTIKTVKNNRKYKDVTLEFDSFSEFLNDNNIDLFFKVWEERLKKKEIDFFNKYVKPKIIEKVSEIIFKPNNKKFNEINRLIDGIFNTSNFKYESDKGWGSIQVIDSKGLEDNKITLTINKSLYNLDKKQLGN